MSNGQDSEAGDDEVEFIRRNISMPQSLADKLEELAEQHYGGNVSHLVRASVSDHERTLNNEGLLALDLIRNDLSTNIEQTGDILEILKEILEESEHIEAQLDSGKPLQTSVNKQSAEACAWDIHNYLNQADSPASAETLTRELKQSQKETRDGIETLLDLSMVESVNPDSENPQYQLMTTTSNTPTNL
jgi:Arc/MetJ-type ribon-helix-helix transcriptional regulator